MSDPTAIYDSPGPNTLADEYAFRSEILNQLARISKALARLDQGLAEAQEETRSIKNTLRSLTNV